MKRTLIILFTASHTNKSESEISEDSDRDFYLTAHDAVEYGIVDKVIERKPES